MLVFLGGWLGRRLFGPTEGIMAACVLAFLPLDIVFSTQLMPDLPLAAWIAASVCLAIAASDRASLAVYFLAGAALGIAALTKEFAIAALMFIPLLVFLQAKSDNTIGRGITALLCFGSGCCFVFLLQIAYFGSYGKPFYFLQMILSNAAEEKNSVADTLFYYQQLFNLHKHPWQNRWFGWLYYCVVLSIPWLCWKRQKNIWLPILWLVSYFIFLQYIGPAISGRQSVERAERFLIPMGVPASLLIAAALGPLFHGRGLRRAAGLAALAVLLASMLSTTILHAYPVETLQIKRWQKLAYVLERLPPAPIYASGDVHSRIEMYSDFRLAVRFGDFRQLRANTVQDTWVIIDGDWGGKKDLRNRSFLESWTLVAELEPILCESRNYLSDFTPKIYWAGKTLPAKDMLLDRQAASLLSGIDRQNLVCIWEAAKVDGTDDVLFSGRSARVRHIDFNPAEGVRYECFEPVQPTENQVYEVIAVKGRGKVTVMEQPGRHNGETLAVRVDDSGFPQDDYYRFLVVKKPLPKKPE
jgi:hypothetical protein